MVALNFMDRFVLPIELGLKRQTIRKHRKGREIRAGDGLQLQRGDRFHPVRIGVATCLDSSQVLLMLDHDVVAFEASRISRASALDRFAVADGFQDWEDLRDWWRVTHGALPHFLGMRHFWGDTFRGPLDQAALLAPPPAGDS